MFGILDRFEDQLAVILIESVEKEHIVDKATLPEGSDIGTVFNVEKMEETFSILSINIEETENRKQRAQQALHALHKKKKRSKFKR
ncbi:DUF3006 domain-containing protein [Pseudogracilibacillus sp. ICA-222130]|uniref:DUF3006 domain-containing protein n=1 Tax=Pseudogracilibacillus sp. ICA-222130 TaxID=3134655 RepID=UPI0030BDDAF1